MWWNLTEPVTGNGPPGTAGSGRYPPLTMRMVSGDSAGGSLNR